MFHMQNAMKPDMKITFAICCVILYAAGVMGERPMRRASFSKENVTRNNTFRLIREIRSGSKLECSTQCMEAISCIAFIFEKSSKDCFLLSDNATAHSQFMLRNSSLTASPTIHMSLQTYPVCNSPGTYEDIITVETVGRTSVACEDTWLIIQRREAHNISFTQDFEAYTNGFGNVHGDFWWGLERIHALTSARPCQPYRLRVEMETWENRTFLYQEYATFTVSSELDQFRLFVSGSSGTAGDGLQDSNNVQFSTYDRAKEETPNQNCGELFQSGWWFSNCFGGAKNGTGANPNGLYTKCSGKYGKECIIWLAAEADAKNPVGLKSFRMMIQ